jgi:hypothetical protein
MALYIGSSEKKQKVFLNEVKYKFNIYTKGSVVDNIIRLLSSDNYILKDINELYLIAKESD